MKTKICIVLTLILLLGLVGWTNGQRRGSSATGWEYKVVDYVPDPGDAGVSTEKGVHHRGIFEGQLNQLGAQGWELVSEHQYQGSFVVRYTFKRSR